MERRKKKKKNEHREQRWDERRGGKSNDMSSCWVFGEQVSITPGFVDLKSDTSIDNFLDNKELCKDDVFLMSFKDLGCALAAIWGFSIMLKQLRGAF